MTQKRRTQSERTAETRAALVDATVTLLLEQGMSGTTVLDICRGANVTTGALQHHFGSKSGLMAEVVQQLFKPFVESPDPDPASAGSLLDRIDRVIERYWRIYGDERYYAVLEILLATRHDPELMELVAGFRKRQLEVLQETLPVEFADVDLPARELQRSIHRMLDLLRGYAVHRLYERDEVQDCEVFAAARSMIERDLRPRIKDAGP